MADKLTLKKKYSRTEFRQKAADLLLRLTTEVGGFTDAGEAAKAKRRAQSLVDPFFFFRTYLPHYFSEEPAAFHYELVELLTERPGAEEVLTPVVVAAPREFAKTTICSFGYVIHQICFKLRHFIIIASDTEDLASDLTGYIYLELLYNERIISDFGELVRENWAVDDFVTLNDIRLKARGRVQRLVGRKHKQHRPDLIILDDMENDANAKSPDQVRKLLKWVLNAVYPSIDMHGNLFWIGTIWARNSALYTAIHSEEDPWPQWRRRLYRAIEDGASLWPARYSLEKLLKQKAAMGTLAFNLQKMNDPINEEGAFQEQWLRFYQPEDLRGKQLVVAGFFDPSLGVSESSDYKAIVTVGLDRREMIYYVLDAYIRRGSLDAALRGLFVRHNQWGFWQLGIEDNLFQRLLLRDVDRMAREYGVTLPARGVTQKTAKETRISRLSSWVERGQIRFCRGQSNQDLLIEQLLYFPSRTVHDDGPDALEGAISLLEGGAGMGLFDFYRQEAERMQAEEMQARNQMFAPGVMHG